MNKLGKTAVFLCLAFCLVRLVEFGFAHIPPLKEGKCYELNAMPLVRVLDIKNHLSEGYSDVEVQVDYGGMFGNEVMRDRTRATFPELRQDVGKETKCY